MMTRMTRDRFTILAVACVLLGAAWLWLSPAGARTAPNVTFTTLEGQRVEMGALRGRPVLVNFWATSCVGCVAEMPHLTELYNELEPSGFEMIGVAMYYDPPNQVLELTRQKQLPYPISLDVDGQIGKAFGEVSLTPTTFLIDPEGKIVFHKIGELDMAQVHSKITSMLSSS